MRELPVEFIGKGQVRGFKFTQEEKNQHGYIYKVEHLGRTWYEVFERRENVRFSVISYPGNKSFGVWAWTANSYEKALERFEEITIKGELDE